MANIAIKGHETRGKEIIELLEMLGGKNVGYSGYGSRYYNYIDNFDNIIGNTELPNDKSFEIYTLEEFEEKFPYKVGDKVLSHNKWEGIIIGMEWSNDDIVYHIRENTGYISHQSVNELQPYKEDTVEEEEENFAECIEKTIQECLFGREGATKEEKAFPPYMDYNIYDITITNEEAEKYMIKIPEIPQSINLSQSNVNEIEVVLGDYEFVLKEGKTYFIKKKPQYPKTYGECCRVLGISDGEFMFTGLSDDEYNLFDNFVMLKRCRDAYWKIAGEELGLGKPWEPDWSTEGEKKYVIEVYLNNIRTNLQGYSNTTLSFPTVEMRNTFFENFKKLIEACKELL